MPSPFPGMDPFLEHPAHFPDLHDSMIAYIRERLQQTLPSPYYSVIGSRVWVESSQRSIGPDAKVFKGNGGSSTVSDGSNALAVTVKTRSQPIVVTVPQDEHHETFVEIYSGLGDHERLVAVIEVLSLTSKTPGAHGRDHYRRKQREILAGQVHLIEVDLLRGGQHTTAAPRAAAEARAGAFDYHVCLHRFEDVENFYIYPIRLQEPLPEIVAPLLPGDDGVALDLQAIFNRCYDTGPYRRRVQYAQAELVPPLRPDHAEWVSNIVQQHV